MKLLYREPPGIEVWQGDSQEVIHELDPQADLVITDVPYAVATKHGSELRLEEKQLGEANVPTMNEVQIVDMIVPICQSCYIFCSTEQIGVFRALLADAMFTTRLIIWEKSNPSPVGWNYLWLSGLEVCVYGKRPKAYFNEKYRGIVPVFKGPSVPANARIGGHPNQKPTWLLEKMIDASCPPGGLVVDMFAGSGSTAVACKHLKRRNISVELSPHYAKAIVQRLKLNK